MHSFGNLQRYVPLPPFKLSLPLFRSFILSTSHVRPSLPSSAVCAPLYGMEGMDTTAARAREHHEYDVCLHEAGLGEASVPCQSALICNFRFLMLMM